VCQEKMQDGGTALSQKGYTQLRRGGFLILEAMDVLAPLTCQTPMDTAAERERFQEMLDLHLLTTGLSPAAFSTGLVPSQCTDGQQCEAAALFRGVTLL